MITTFFVVFSHAQSRLREDDLRLRNRVRHDQRAADHGFDLLTLQPRVGFDAKPTPSLPNGSPRGPLSAYEQLCGAVSAAPAQDRFTSASDAGSGGGGATADAASATASRGVAFVTTEPRTQQSLIAAIRHPKSCTHISGHTATVAPKRSQWERRREIVN